MNFRANNLNNIKAASIDLKGITLIFGENGSGKSNLINGLWHAGTRLTTPMRNRDNTTPTLSLETEVNCHYLSYWTNSPSSDPTNLPEHSISTIAKNHPNIIKCLNDIIGGEFVYESEVMLKKYNGSIVPFKDAGHGVKHMWEFWAYLNYCANYGDLILMDCPERYLSLDNQRKLARLFALLANNSIKVCIATQSDIIAKEINILIGMYARKDKLPYEVPRDIYSNEMFIPHTMVTAYDFVIKDKKSDSFIENTEYYNVTLEMPVEEKLGIDCYRVDYTIESMNTIHEALIWTDNE